MIYVNFVQCKEWFTQKFVCLKTQDADMNGILKMVSIEMRFLNVGTTFNLSAAF